MGKALHEMVAVGLADTGMSVQFGSDRAVRGGREVGGVDGHPVHCRR